MRSAPEPQLDGRAGMKTIICALAFLVAAGQMALAEDRGTIRFGLSAQDWTSPEPGPALRGELILPKPDILKSSLPAWAVPAPLAGVSAKLGHGTSFLYAGALWTVPIGTSLFAEASVSIAANNGLSEPHQGSAALGCRAGFREELGLGWRFDEAWSVVAMVEHFSNANLCNHNRGLTNVGLVLGRSF